MLNKYGYVELTYVKYVTQEFLRKGRRHQIHFGLEMGYQKLYS